MSTPNTPTSVIVTVPPGVPEGLRRRGQVIGTTTLMGRGSWKRG